MEYPLSDLGAIHVPTDWLGRNRHSPKSCPVPKLRTKGILLVEQVVPDLKAVSFLLVKVRILRTRIHSTLYRVWERWSESHIRPNNLRWVELWSFNFGFRCSKGMKNRTKLLRNNRPLLGLPPEYPLLSFVWRSLILPFQLGKALNHPGDMGLVLTRLLNLGGV